MAEEERKDPPVTVDLDQVAARPSADPRALGLDDATYKAIRNTIILFLASLAIAVGIDTCRQHVSPNQSAPTKASDVLKLPVFEARVHEVLGEPSGKKTDQKHPKGMYDIPNQGPSPFASPGVFTQ